MSQFDLLVVGSGLFGAVIAREAIDSGKKVLILEKRDHVGGNCYTQNWADIEVHMYGAHIFRTADPAIWKYMERFCEFNHFVNSPIANYKGSLFNLPFNMNTFYQLWGVKTPTEAKATIESQRIPCDNPTNLEEHVLSIAGSDIYNKLVKGYTEKQWGKKCSELPPSIMRRIPFRFIFDNNYFNDPLQGVPKAGYTDAIEKMIDGVEVRLGVDYLSDRARYDSLADRVVYTGAIDAFYDYAFGPLEYRSLRFEHEELPLDNYQGVAVMNFTDGEVPFTRIIEHKHFNFGNQSSTVISREYPVSWSLGDDPYYPMEDEKNRSRYSEYAKCAAKESNVFFGGRLGEYRYYDMQDTIKSALEKARVWGIS